MQPFVLNARQLLVGNHPLFGIAASTLPLFCSDATETAPLAHGELCLTKNSGNLGRCVVILDSFLRNERLQRCLDALQPMK
jgi:hypothetical protein